MSFYQLLPSFNEAFVRLAQTRERGCLLVFNAQEAVHVFVRDGLVVAAQSGKLEGMEALDRALILKGSSYGWIGGAESAKETLALDMQDYIVKKGLVHDQRGSKTIRLPGTGERRERRPDIQYYFIPEESPTVKIKVKKVTNVLGREGTCDIYVESRQVSRRHCLLQVTERGLLVKDLESTNGIFVNGIPMVDGYINDGDRLALGTYVLTLHRETL